MKPTSFCKIIISELLFLFSIFKGDSINNELSIQNIAYNTIIFFCFTFTLIFGLPELREFTCGQIIFSTFYPNYSEMQFYQMFNYFPIFLFSLFANIIFSFAATIFLLAYICVENKTNYLKNPSLLIKIFCQSSKCFSLCGVVILLFSPIIFVFALDYTKLPILFNPKIGKIIIYIILITQIILIFGLVRPFSKLRNENQITHPYHSFNFFNIIDKNFPTSLLLFQLIMSMMFFFNLDRVQQLLFYVTPSLTSDAGSLKVLHGFIISSSTTPPAIKIAFKEAGTSKYISCWEMPDVSTRDACLNQIFLSSNGYNIIKNFGEKDYCKNT